jgi:hypothetical protein
MLTITAWEHKRVQAQILLSVWSSSMHFNQGGKAMRRIFLAAVLTLTMISITLADDVAFRKTRIVDARGKQADASLIFSEGRKSMIVRLADRDFVSIPYEKLDKLSYEYTKKHRVTQGAIVMIASLGAGAVVMLTKSKSHWLYVDYHEENIPKSLVLRMDKKEYKEILTTAKAQTGKEVEFLKDAGIQKKKTK